MGPHPRRQNDSQEENFLGDRQSSGLPFPWRKAIVFTGLIATFVGTLLMQILEAKPQRKSDSSNLMAVQLLVERIANLESKIDELSLSMTNLSLRVQSNGDNIQVIQKRLSVMASDRRSQEEQNATRAAEILSILTEFRERGIKRK